MAQRFRQEKRYAFAVRATDIAKAIAPFDSKVITARLFIFNEMHDWPRALIEAKELVHHYPHYSFAHYMFGYVSGHLGDTSTSLLEVSRAIAMDSTVSSYYWTRALHCQTYGLLDTAAADWKRVFELAPDTYSRVRALTFGSTVNARLGRYDIAEKGLHEAERLSAPQSLIDDARWRIEYYREGHDAN